MNGITNRVVSFAYAVGDRVRVRETQHPGQVTGCMADNTGEQYRVVWWSNGERKCEWLYAFEIEAQPATPRRDNAPTSGAL